MKNHISPLLGTVKIGQLDAEVLDSFYAELRRCRKHCSRKRGTIDHRVAREHECDERCRLHRCKPLAATTIRHIHFILSGAFKKAIRWAWIKESPTSWAELLPAPAPNPKPPRAEQAAQVINEAWKDSDWAAMIWTAMTTGVRRGELCAVKVESVDFTPDSVTQRYDRMVTRLGLDTTLRKLRHYSATEL